LTLTNTVAIIMLIFTPQETLLYPCFIKCPVIIIILLKGAQTNAFVFVLVGGVRPSKWRESKMLKFCKYNVHPRKWTMSTEETHKCI